MSQAAEDYVRDLTHPQVTDSEVARAVLDAIARLIPEGETTTPLIGMEAIAQQARVHRRTVWKWLDVLVAIGEVRVVDGLPGRPARYMLIHVAGAPPISAAPLPLMGAARPPRRKTPPPSATPDLFDHTRSNTEEPMTVTITRITRITGWITRITGSAMTWITGITGFRSQGSQGSQVAAVSASIDRARDVHTQNVQTHTAREDLPKSADAKPPPCRWTGTVHVWCGGRVHVPMDLHREFIRKHGRHPGQTDADVEAVLLAFYARKSAALSPDAHIVGNDFTFWRNAYAEAFSTETPRAGPAAQPHRYNPRGDDAWSQILRHLKPHVNSDAFNTWFTTASFVETRGDVIEVKAESPKHAAWIDEHYRAILADAVEKVQPGAHVEFVSADAHQRKSG